MTLKMINSNVRAGTYKNNTKFFTGLRVGTNLLGIALEDIFCNAVFFKLVQLLVVILIQVPSKYRYALQIISSVNNIFFKHNS